MDFLDHPITINTKFTVIFTVLDLNIGCLVENSNVGSLGYPYRDHIQMDEGRDSIFKFLNDTDSVRFSKRTLHLVFFPKIFRISSGNL